MCSKRKTKARSIARPRCSPRESIWQPARRRDLDGHGYFRQIPVATYYLSSLNVDSLAGEEHDRWDVPVTVTPSHETYILLSNINAIQTNGTP